MLTIRKKYGLVLGSVFILSLITFNILLNKFFDKSFKEFVVKDMEDIYKISSKNLEDYTVLNSIDKSKMTTEDFNSRVMSFIVERVNSQGIFYNIKGEVISNGINNGESIDLNIIKSKVWDEYSERCIACGRCNFVCPTCTCFTMQDIFYKDNGKVGERRRVWASCQVDGYTDMAGGHSFRKEKGQRMRFKVLHKVYDYKKRWGYHMCVGCGRCDDACPEYISFSNCVNKLEKAMDEVK